MNMTDKKTYYAVYLDCISASSVFPTREEAEEFRRHENEDMESGGEPPASEVYEVQMTEEEYKNIPED